MRMKTIIIVCALLSASATSAQDSLRTVLLQEVVTTGTRFEIPVEKSGKTIYKLNAQDLQKNAGKQLGDILNEVPGIQIDGNFGTPGTNISYYARGARNRQTLILIDGVPLNDPSAISAEYDLRYIPVSQIESVEVVKGGLSTLYGTGAAAAVINIRLKAPGSQPISGSVDLNAGSFNTYSENVRAGGSTKEWSYMVMANNIQSEGFTSAFNDDPNNHFDDDGFSRQNVLVKAGYRINPSVKVNVFTAYEKFNADYDEFEFTDGPNVQHYKQYRVGVNPDWKYKNGVVEANVVFNNNHRDFESSFPANYEGANLQAELVQRHHFSNAVQGLFGLNYQHMKFDQKDAISGDTARISMLDPYASFLAELPSGLNLHAGLRLNTHTIYGSKLVYNINPSILLNRNGTLTYKLLVSLSSSYVTPSLYQLYSIYGNKELLPEEAVSVEGGFSVYGGEAWTFNFVWFQRDEKLPIDFVSLFDTEGNYVGGRYENLSSKRRVNGIEISAVWDPSDRISATINYAHNDTDRPQSFYRIPRNKWGAALSVRPLDRLNVSIKYAYTGDRTVFDYRSFSELTLSHYQLVDLYASFSFLNDRLTVYGAVNNLADEQFIAVLGYKTRGRNYNAGLSLKF